jgi:hypothetical protein
MQHVDELTGARDRLVAAVHDPVEIEDHEAHAIRKAAHAAG